MTTQQLRLADFGTTQLFMPAGKDGDQNMGDSEQSLAGEGDMNTAAIPHVSFEKEVIEVLLSALRCDGPPYRCDRKHAV